MDLLEDNEMMTIARHVEQKDTLEAKLEMVRKSLADGADRAQVKN